jgi:pimeloyl-ACP methyl ester carboxylesterase
MDLFERNFGGDGRPVVILHGLFGSSQNWAGVGRRLSDMAHIVGLDLRNHGDSPHAREHSLAACVEDVRQWTETHATEPVRFIGHSMGGLVAMGFALRHPEMTAGVAAVDIAPRPYPPDHAAEYRALCTDIRPCRSRAELDALLAPVLPETRERQFMLTNAVRDGDGFRWRLEPEILSTNTVAADFAGAEGTYGGPALLIACGRSGYVRSEDHSLMRRFFPGARIESIPEADHWPHVTASVKLDAILRYFLVMQ